MMIAFFMRRIFPVVVFDAKSEMIEISGVNVLVMSSSTNPASKIVFWPRLLLVAIAQHLANHSIRSRQYVRRNRQGDLLGSFQIDDELKILRLLDGKIGGLSTF